MKATLPRLIGYYWKSGSWSLWIQVVLAILCPLLLISIPFFVLKPHAVFEVNSWGALKSVLLNTTFTLAVFPILLGIRFFIQAPGSDSVRGIPIGDSEFLLSRPISRTEAFRSTFVLYYGILGLMALPFIALGLWHPTVPVWLGGGLTSEYLAAFPNTRILHGTTSPIVLLPLNAFYATAIPCFLLLLTAIAVQGLSLIRWSLKLLRVVLPLIFVVPAYLSVYRNRHLHSHTIPSTDDLYLGFVHRFSWIALGTLALFLLVQWLSVRKAARADAV